MAQESSDGTGPFGPRYNDIRDRFEIRVSSIERALAVQAQEFMALKADHAQLRSELSKHLDHAVGEAREAAKRQEAVLDKLSDLTSDVRVIREAKGSVSIAIVAQVTGILSVLSGVIFWLAKAV